MVLVEYRIPMPCTVEEFNRAWLAMVVEASMDTTGDGEGVEVLKNEVYDNTDGHLKESIAGIPVPKNKGQYTLKNYFIDSKVPAWLRFMLPNDSMVLVEEAYNAYPDCLTILHNKYLYASKFRVIIRSRFLEGTGNENAHELSAADLKRREIVNIDIREQDKEDDHYKVEFDPSVFQSKKTGRGPLGPNWQKNFQPIMTAYKLVDCKFAYWGLQGKTESVIIGQNLRAFQLTHARLFCLTDLWIDFTFDEIRLLEDACKKELEKMKDAASDAYTGKSFEDLVKEAHATKEEKKDKSSASTATAGAAAAAAAAASADSTEKPSNENSSDSKVSPSEEGSNSKVASNEDSTDGKGDEKTMPTPAQAPNAKAAAAESNPPAPSTGAAAAPKV
eukprot:g4167.t1